MKPTALITGASRGIGLALAQTFAHAGYNLSLCCSSTPDALKALSGELSSQYGCTVLTFVGDIADPAFVEEMIQKTLKECGRIDVLINNAGISHVGLLSDMSIEEWNRILSVNLTSVFSACKYVIPNMVHNKSGKIINISSVWGNVGASCEAAYSATKGGINALTKALGKELAPSGISVNAIACGCIDTSMNACFSEEDRAALAEEIPAGRFGCPSEVAELALSIAQSSAYLTGQVITLDGGWT